jgi:hypothetical protein
LALRGGLLVSFYKGKGPTDDLGSQRAILLASNVAKAGEKVLFPAVQQALADLAPSSMCGGIARRGTDFASHILRELAADGHCRNVSTSLLFVDAKDAFYALVKSAVTGVPESDELVARICARLKLPADTMRTLHQQTGDAFGGRLGAHLERQVEDSMRLNWFAMEGAKSVAIPGTGTRPGMSWANALFNGAFAHIVNEIEDKMSIAGLGMKAATADQDCFGRPLHLESPDVMSASFVDDLVLFNSSDEPAELHLMTAATARITKCAFEGRGFS